MKTIQKITLLLLLVSAYSFSQTGVTVTYYNGTTQDFSVATAGKLYFESDNLYVKADAATAPTTIPVNIIRKITFGTALGTGTFGDNKNNLFLYPNPGANFIRLKSDVSEDLKTSIYSITGQLVLQGTYKSDQDIDVSSLPTGLYLVR
ncbi:T9SS type A sorting domain-containing protein [Flavobacterium sp. 3HN19-14]|uniref:T9SS type A sorting domain-containing protein n=1 Tax=Flavobacterium sp. 3HN19-14 TaxID=3448133 RepID=UPI003EDFE45F